MHITFSPMRRDDKPVASVNGDVITIDGEPFDFTSIPEGGELPAGAVPCQWIVGPVTRVAGEIHLTMILPHGPDPAQNVAFPEPITVTGPVMLPGQKEPADVGA